MINPATYNIKAYQGATYSLNMTWAIGGTAVNLTGYSARMQVRESYDSGTAVVSITSGTGITLGGTAGSIILELTPTTTAGVPSGQYVYDLELQTSGGYVTRLLEGNFTVDPEVTR